MTRNAPITQLTCPKCGRSFIKPVSSIYKANTKEFGKVILCSYTCWMQVKGIDRHGNKITE